MQELLCATSAYKSRTRNVISANFYLKGLCTYKYVWFLCHTNRLSKRDGFYGRKGLPKVILLVDPLLTEEPNLHILEISPSWAILACLNAP